MKSFICIITILSLSFIFVSCANIRHKSFRTTASFIGLKASMVDPTGSGAPCPLLIFGSCTNIITTIAPGTKLSAETDVGSMIHARPALKDKLSVDSTQSGNYNIQDKKLIYKAKNNNGTK